MSGPLSITPAQLEAVVEARVKLAVSHAALESHHTSATVSATEVTKLEAEIAADTAEVEAAYKAISLPAPTQPTVAEIKDTAVATAAKKS